MRFRSRRSASVRRRSASRREQSLCPNSHIALQQMQATVFNSVLKIVGVSRKPGLRQRVRKSSATDQTGFDFQPKTLCIRMQSVCVKHFKAPRRRRHFLLSEQQAVTSRIEGASGAYGCPGERNRRTPAAEYGPSDRDSTTGCALSNLLLKILAQASNGPVSPVWRRSASVRQESGRRIRRGCRGTDCRRALWMVSVVDVMHETFDL